MTVQGDQQAPGEQDLAAAGQLYPGLRDGDPGCQQAADPNPVPIASTCRGRAADSAAMAAGSARGSAPRTAITRAPATRAVVTAASVAASRLAGAHEQRQVAQGRGCPGRGQHRRVGDHADARQPAASTFPAIPAASTARGSRALICARSMALAAAGPRPAGPSGRRGVRPARRSAAAARGPAGPTWRPPPGSAGRSGPATTTTGAEANNLCAKLPATTSAAPASTDVADAGSRVRAARRA